ncbi:hypothetical protein [Casimicrobium huifangae]|jgi:hypothetical protein|uniref:hypothetical protein n=1 Tax=Casimicrobium huifangae TaxID=2591109 RepID=UPI002C771664|nr:hypothetical protein [Casimicrobium huifangae]
MSWILLNHWAQWVKARRDTPSALSFDPGLQFTQTFPAEVSASALLNLLIVHSLINTLCVMPAPIVFLH